jgi:hypothetical protein
VQIVFILGYRCADDDLILGYHGLTVVALDVLASGLHDAAVGVGDVGLPIMIDGLLGGLWLATAFLLPAGRFLGLAGTDLLLLLLALGFGLFLKTLFGCLKPLQTILWALKLFGQHIPPTLRTELLVLLSIRLLGFFEHLGNFLLQLSETPVGLKGGIAFELGSVKEDPPKVDKARLTAQPQNLHKYLVDRLLMATPEPGDGTMIRNHIARKPPKRQLLRAGLGDLSGRSDTLRVSIYQDCQHHGWIVRGPSLYAIRAMERPQIHLADAVPNEAHHVILRNPLIHRRREQQQLFPISGYVTSTHINSITFV